MTVNVIVKPSSSLPGDSNPLLEEGALYEAKWSITLRRTYHAEHPDRFAGTEQDKPLSYPIRDADDVRSCATLYGKSADPEQCKRNIIRIATALKLTAALPDDWKDGAKESEESLIVDGLVLEQVRQTHAQQQEHLTEAAFQPKPRIGQLKVCFLRDNAISRNGRQYPSDSVATLVRSGQVALTSSDAIITSCISHEAADNQENNPLLVSGKATKIWQEGAEAFALFDIPDTSTGRDMVALIAGGYIPPTMSLRASGAVMKVERGKSVPQVTGDLKLEGIDFTSQPGLEFARIQELVLESSGAPQTIIDVFDVDGITLLLGQEQEDEQITMTKKATESQLDAVSSPGTPGVLPATTPAPQTIAEGPNTILQPLTSGVSTSVDGAPGSEYADRVFPNVGATIPPVDFFKGGSGGVSAQESRTTHDHMATMLGMSCAPGGGATESAKSRFFNKTMESHATAVHDLHANKLGLGCEGSYQQMAPLQNNPTPDDGPDDDAMESAHRSVPSAVVPPVVTTKENDSRMNEQEALALLQERGYTGVTPPKTPEEKLREAITLEFEGKLAAQRREIEESQQRLMAQITPAQARAQRTTLVESAHTGSTREVEPLPNSPRARRTRVQEALMEADWQQLADPSQPLPDGVGWQDVLKHFGRLMVTDYQTKFGTVTVKPRHS